jgi:hypothetical protein
VQFGEDSAKLEHVDGSPMCTPGEEPPEVRPAARWPQATDAVIVPGPVLDPPGEIADADVPDYLLASAQRAQERRERLKGALDHSETVYGTGKRGGVGWGTVLLFLCLAAAVAGCFWYVIANWPAK